MRYWDSSQNTYHSGMILNGHRKFRGKWWPQDRADLKHSGQLVIREKFVPFLKVESWDPQPDLFARPVRAVVWGESYEGVPFTLFNCRNTGTEFYNRSIGRSGYVPELVLWGCHSNSVDEPFCNKIRVECPPAIDIGRSHPHLIFSEKADGLDRITIPSRSELVPGGEIGEGQQIELVLHWLSGSDSVGAWTVTPRIFIELRSARPLSILECQRMLARLRSAVRFSACTPAHFVTVELWSEASQLPCGTYFPVKSAKKSGREFHYYSLQESSKDSIGQSIRKMFEVDSKIHAAIHEFQSAVDDLHEDVEAAFFNIARILERLLGYQNGGEDRIIAEKDHEHCVSSMLAAIGQSPSDYQERIAHLLENANCHSPRSKIKHFINSDGQAELLVPASSKRTKFISRVVAARNAIAHFSTSREDPVTWQDIEMLIRLTDLCIWRLLGIKDIPLAERYGQWAVRQKDGDIT